VALPKAAGKIYLEQQHIRCTMIWLGENDRHFKPTAAKKPSRYDGAAEARRTEIGEFLYFHT
jgi:hypothetical protein